MSNRRNLSQTADEIVDFIDKNPTDTARKPGGRDVSTEPRVPKGNADGGQWTAAETGASKSTTASRSGKAVTIKRPDGSTEIRKGESRSWRNNNPGNIGVGPRARKYGAIGSNGKRAIFPDEATGTAAQESLLKERYSGSTINDMIAAWAPAEDGNDVPGYQAFIRNATGLNGDRKVGDLTSDELHRLMDAQRRKEGWKVGTVTKQ